jgi:hypothetical protein
LHSKRKGVTIDDNSDCEMGSDKSYKEDTSAVKPSSRSYLRMALVLGMMACSTITTESLTAPQINFTGNDIE